MKHNIIACVLIFFLASTPFLVLHVKPLQASSKSPAVEWNKTYGTTRISPWASWIGNWIVQTRDDEYALAGYTNSFSGDDSYEVWLIKLAGPSRRTWIVDDDGPADFHTIQEAINAASNGDTISVRNGIYYEHVIVNKSVSIFGESQSGTIVDGNLTEGAFLLVADHINVSGFTMRNGGSGYGVCGSSDGNNISQNVITNVASGVWIVDSNYNTISDNVVTSCSLGVGIHLLGSANNNVSNNIVASNYEGIAIASGGDYDIWSMNADGTNQTRLTLEKSSESYPYWSPDGSKIAYTSYPEYRFMDPDIWVMNSDGTNKTEITEKSPALLGGWSPDGSQIVFYSFQTGPWEIWTMNADGTNQRQLTKDQGVNYKPSWSPDGSKIAFMSYRDNASGIWIMNPDGTNQIRLADGKPSTSGLSWSPDGSKIAFDSYYSASRKWTIWIMNSDGTNQTELISAQFQEASPQWSPDGAKIAYSGGDDWWAWDIWTMNTDGSNKTRLTDNFRTRFCSWSPDSSQLAFAPYNHVQSLDNVIVNNTVTDNQEEGIIITWDGSRNAVENNLISNNGHGLNLVQANGNTIINNTISNNTKGSYQGLPNCGTGIYLDRSESNLLRDNKLTNNALNFLIGPDYLVENGTRAYYVNDVDESNLVNGRPICYWVNQNDRQVPANAGCVLLVNSTNILVENLPSLEHNGFGVELYRTTNSTIRNVTASNNLFYGIDLILSNGNDLLNNTAASNTGIGIRLQLSSGNNLQNNTVKEALNQAAGMGVMLSGSGNNTLRSNVMARNRLNFVVGGGPPTYYPYYDNDVDESNTVDGKPIYYWINQNGRTVPSDGGTVLLVNCSDITVENLEITNEYVGVGFLNTLDSKVENVTVQNCWVGIGLQDSCWDSISDCKITDGWVAIMVVNGSENVIQSNILANMTGSVSALGAPFAAGGLILIGSLNKIFHNNFINNTVHAIIMEASYGNVWDNGCEGNYWSDYNGTDSNGDGIGDTPYVIDSNNQDNYPLMNRFWNPADINHDLKVDLRDVYRTALAFGSYPGHPKWNPHCDINEDGTVDLKDYYTVCKSFGKTYT